VTNSSATAATDDEYYVITGLQPSDTDRVVSAGDYPNVTAVHGMFYPYGTAREDDLLLYWDSLGIVYAAHTTTAGWHNYNDPGMWSTPVAVAQAPGSGVWEGISHPWATFETDGYDVFVRLFVNPLQRIGWLSSLDENGEDFGLGCEDTDGCVDDCDYGDLCALDDAGAEIILEESDDTGGPDPLGHITHAGHGRLLYDDIAQGPIDFSTDDVQMLFTSSTDHIVAMCPLVGDNGPDDLHMADWDHTEGWSVLDGNDDYCADSLGEDQHDPGEFPLHDVFEVYAQDQNLGQEYTISYMAYDDGIALVEADTGQIQVCWDDGVTPCGASATIVEGTCMEDLAHIHFIDGSGPHKGILFKIWAEDPMGGILSDGCSGGYTAGVDGIVFAECVDC
jgi:hypothetical protein